MYGHTISGILNLTGFIGYIGELKMTINIDENIKSFRQIYSDCSDIKICRVKSKFVCKFIFQLY